jgi:CHAT domain-containing protein
MFYADLCDHLLLSHDVLTFAYDWRRPLADDARALAELVERALAKTAAAGQPVRLMAHSMGGLVVRAMIAGHRATWDRLVARAGGRLVMLGTPNRGSHGTVEALLGLAGSIRKLALLEPVLGLQEIVDLVAAFPGAVQLLPRPGFRDTGGSRHDYYSEAFWSEFKQGNDSFWHGANIGAAPAAALLSATEEAWRVLDEDLPNPDRIAYVAGCGYETPCGIERETEPSPRLRMVGTLAGDGTVTHDSGLLEVLERNQRVWFMDADHVGLTDTAEHFPALVDLLERGETHRLPQTRPAVRGAEHTFRYEAGPVLYPTQEELERAALGGRRPARRKAKASQVLTVSCRAMDLRHAIDPILVGHYDGDAIAGAEAQLDRVLDNRLTLRHHLDAYAGPAGSVAVVLDEPNEEQARVGIRRGAVVIGLGDFGSLTPASLTAGVQQAVLRYLLQLHDRSIERAPPASIGLASLLLGYNSTTSISIDESVALVTRGVMRANRQFAESAGVPLGVERLEFVELFEDTAISAAKAVRGVATHLEREARRLGFRIEAAETLACGAGMRSRLETASSSFGYWPRLIVTDPDASRNEDVASTPPDRSRHPRTLRYVYLSMRARAETMEHQRQPAAVDRLIATSIRNPRYRRETARALFNLLMPEELKAIARQTDNLVLVVDATTASLPWETLVADEEPLIKTTAMVRQFASTTFRHHVRPAREKRAYVVGNPSTAGFYAALGRGMGAAVPPAAGGASAESATLTSDALPDLPGAASEARVVADILSGAGFDVAESPPGEDGMSVVERLYQRPYRIVHVAAHGVFALGEGADRRNGVVLSDGLMLTASEIAALEVVPDLVFLNCCHTGRIDAGPAPAFNRLAASIARELIECGVRVVIAAGWAVDDDAASFFAERFYQAFVHENRPFGRAVHAARLATYESFPDSNTWGAFQAYGEPSFVIDPTNLTRRGADDFRPVAPQELVARIELLRNDLPCDPRRDDVVDMKELGDRVDALLRQTGSGAWNEEQEVLYVLGRLYADAGDFESARRRYEAAIAREDTRARVPLAAIEQLANMEVREGIRRLESGGEDAEALIRRGLARMLAFARAASGTEDLREAAVSPERCALIGSAYKRLARVLPAWRSAAKAGPPGGIRDALEQSRDWYARAEGDPARPDFRPYESQNRIALDAVLGTATPADAALAVQTGEAAAKRYARSRDRLDLVMEADGLLLARLVAGGLGKSSAAEAQAVEREVVTRYLRLWEGLPQTARERDSVLSQIELLAHFFAQRVDDEGTRHDAVADRLRRIAATLRGEVPAAAAIDLAQERRERTSPGRDQRAARSPERKRAPHRRTRKHPRAKT